MIEISSTRNFFRP